MYYSTTRTDLDVYTSDFDTNSYGESWDSFCKKLGVPVQNQQVPKIIEMFGPLCNQTVNSKTDSKTLYYSTLKLKYTMYM